MGPELPCRTTVTNLLLQAEEIPLSITGDASYPYPPCGILSPRFLNSCIHNLQIWTPQFCNLESKIFEALGHIFLLRENVLQANDVESKICFVEQTAENAIHALLELETISQQLQQKKSVSLDRCASICNLKWAS